MKYVIIGNGIIALSTAFRLTQQIKAKDSITIVGLSTRVGSATMAAGAMLNSFGEINPYSLRTKTGRYHFELSRLATKKWPEFENQLISAAGNKLTKNDGYGLGTYIINNTSSDDFDDRNFEAIVNALKDCNEQFDYVTPRDIPNYHPSQRKRATRAIYIPGEGWLNPKIVLSRLDHILKNHPQVNYIDDKVLRLIKNGSTIEAIAIAKGKHVEGDVFLLANGASAGDVLESSELKLKIQNLFYGVGVSLEIHSEGFSHKKCIRTPNRGGGCGIYSLPHYLGPDKSNEHIMIGATNYISPNPRYNPRLSGVEGLMKNAIEEINNNFFAATLVNINVGWRPTTQDTYPILGKTSINNFVIATGTKRDGFQLSPVISEMIASIMLGNEVDTRFGCYKPEREIIREINRKDAVEMIVSGLMSEHYQHDYNPPNVKMNAQVIETHRKEIEELHDKIGAYDWGIPPELVPMYRRGHARFNK